MSKTRNTPTSQSSTPPVKVPVQGYATLPPEASPPSNLEGVSAVSEYAENPKHAKRRAKQKHTDAYAQDVYKRRFKQFHYIRLLSWLVGGSIFLIMSLGMWSLYTQVFTTIENTEHLFLITEKRRTNVIQFTILEDVRSSWNEKYNATSTEFAKPLFSLPPEPEEIDVNATQ